MKKKLSSFFTALLLFVCLAATAQTFPTGFSTTNFGSNWNQPVGATFTPDGLKLFVWEKAGLVYVLNRQTNGTYTKQNNPVIQWRYLLLVFSTDSN